MNLYCDIETLAAGDPIDPLTLTPPGNISKKETIDAWYAEKAPTLALEKYKERALNSMEGRILMIGYAIGDMAVQVLEGEEKDILSALGDALHTQYKEPWTWVTWNGNTFDIPYIWRKAVKYNLKELRNNCPKTNQRLCIDVMKTWSSDYRDMVKMSACAVFLGIEHSNVSGKDVFDLYQKGDIDAIKQHCLDDVETLRRIYHRIYD